MSYVGEVIELAIGLEGKLVLCIFGRSYNLEGKASFLVKVYFYVRFNRGLLNQFFCRSSVDNAMFFRTSLKQVEFAHSLYLNRRLSSYL